MRKRMLGSVEVSEIGMGCMGLSHGYGAIPDEGYSVEAIRAALAYGCTHFDTAEAYGPNLLPENRGHNERIVGKALAGAGDAVTVATKLHLPADEVAEQGVADALRRHLEASLERLQRGYADVYYLHRMGPAATVEEVAEGMGLLAEEGLIRGWGLSQVTAGTIAAAHAVFPLSAVQNIYSMAERGVEGDVIPFCEAHGIGLVAFSPVASGLLSGKVGASTQFEPNDDVRKFVPQLRPENIEANEPIVEMLCSFAGEKGATPAQICLAWMLRRSPCAVPIPGSKNKGRILENLGASEVEFADDEFGRLQSALDSLEVHGHRGYDEAEGRGFLDRK